MGGGGAIGAPNPPLFQKLVPEIRAKMGQIGLSGGVRQM